MSLRAELHEALDEVTPAAPHLELRVTASILGAARRRKVLVPGRGGAPWTRPFRGPLALVAAALVVVLIGALVVGGRLLRDLNSPPSTVNQTELKKLEAVPLRLPTVSRAADCPVSPLTDVSAHGPEALLYGDGPVYTMSLGYNQSITNWGTWSVFGVMVDPARVHGLILVRARDLQTNQRVVFARIPFHPAGQAGDGIPTGTVVRREVIQDTTVQVYPEVVVDTSRPYPLTRAGDWPIFKAYIGYPKAATGCVGLQIDGTGFSEVVIVSR